MNFKDILNNILSKFNFLDYEGKVSLTNITVAAFVLITAIRALFGGSELNLGFFNWKVQNVDYAASLPLLYSLLNYGHKRTVIDNQKESK
jgi:hypothetical protein